MLRKPLNPLLVRQLLKHQLSFDQLPTDKTQWINFLLRLDKTYLEYEDARISSDNILAVSLKEMEMLQTERLETNAYLLKELNENLNLILQASDLGTWDWNLETNHVRFDQRWCEIIGYTLEETPQTFETFEKAVHSDDFGKVMELANDYIQGKVNKFEVKFRMIHKDDHWVHILAKGKIMKIDSAGKPIRFMGTHSDISEDVKIQQEIEDQKVKLIHHSRLASLGEMSAGIAHEINNPLAIIMGSVGLLNKFIDNPEKFKSKIDSINKSCMRISKILNGLKKFSRSAEKSELKIHNLTEIISEAVVLTDIKSSLSTTNVSYQCTKDLMILCNESEIEQVLINLINNAVDAVKDLEDRWVKINAFSEADRIILRIIDSGPTINSEIEKKLFEPFFTTKRVGEGTGLGLSISKGILDDHNASISLNRDFATTCFEIVFKKLGV